VTRPTLHGGLSAPIKRLGALVDRRSEAADQFSLPNIWLSDPKPLTRRSIGDLSAKAFPESAMVAASARAKNCSNRIDHFCGSRRKLDHFGQAGEAEANGNASVPIATSWRRDGRKPSSNRFAALRSLVSNPSVNRS
jgi:hypothetical protein